MLPTSRFVTMMPMSEPLSFAKSLALEAGAIMLKHFSPGLEHTVKEDRTPLTRADTEINDLVLARIEAAFPEHSVLGEEGSRIKESEYLWVVDPIDGTSPYMRGVPTNVFSLALVQDGKPILGVVYDPYMKRMYHAVQGTGAYMNDTRIHTSAHESLDESSIAIDGFRGFSNLEFLETLRNSNSRFLSFGSTIYAHMLVASGQLEGVIFPLVRPSWDCASAKIIVEEAGGRTSDLVGKSQRYDRPVNGFISAGSATFHEALLTAIAPSIPDLPVQPS